MAAPIIFRSLADKVSQLNTKSSLTNNLVFAQVGHVEYEIVNEVAATFVGTGIVRGTTPGGRRSFRVPGGGSNSNAINYGAHVASANLAGGASTYAFYCTVNDPTNAGWAMLGSRNSGTTTGGWRISGTGAATDILFASYLSGGRVESHFNGFPVGNIPGTIVFTYDGGTLQSGIKCYINGQQVSASSGFNGSGISQSDAGLTLNIASVHIPATIDQAHLGDMMVAMLAKRVWTDAEIAQFAANPYAAFQSSPSMVYSFGPAPTGPTTGTSNIVFAGSATELATGVLAGTSAITFDGSSTELGSGVLAGTSAITFDETGMLSSTIVGTSTITFAGSATAIAEDAGTSAITFGTNTTISGSAVLAGESDIVFGSSATMGSPIVGTSSITFNGSALISATLSMGGMAGIVFSGQLIPGIIAYMFDQTTSINFMSKGKLSFKINHQTTQTSITLLDTSQRTINLL